MSSRTRAAYMMLPGTLRNLVGGHYMRLKRAGQMASSLLRYGSIDMFSYIIVEVSSGCNRACAYCPNSVSDRCSLKNNRLMDESLFRKVVDDLALMRYAGTISYSFYNEPCIDGRLPGFTDYVRSKLPAARSVIVTNGTLLAPRLYDRLVASGVAEFQITQHGPAMERCVVELFNHLGLNASQAEEDVKVKDLTISCGGVLIKYVRYKDDSPLYNRGGLVKPANTDTYPACKRYGFAPVINVDGDMVVCCNDYFSQIRFGNVRDMSIQALWRSSGYRRLRMDISKNLYSLDICRKCVGLQA